jgi:type IV pilus assembly protein PilE
MPASRIRGFTLIEIMITVAIVAILASVALPSYRAYIERSRVPEGLDLLSSYAARMEQAYQDTGTYGAVACTPALPAATNFTASCELSNSGQGYTATATGINQMAGYRYTINHNGVRRTVDHPKGAPAANCWSIRGTTCDS